jgi:hypothetical protein
MRQLSIALKLHGDFCKNNALDSDPKYVIYATQ